MIRRPPRSTLFPTRRSSDLSTSNGSVSLIVGVTKDLTQKIQAGKVIGKVAEKVGGKGGGRPDLAEAGFSASGDRKSTRLNSSHTVISYAVFCLKKKSAIHPHLLRDFFFFNDTATTEIYTLSYTTLFRSLDQQWQCLPHRRRHQRPDAENPGWQSHRQSGRESRRQRRRPPRPSRSRIFCVRRSEEHTSELQSHSDLVCRLLLEKKKRHPPSSTP